MLKCEGNVEAYVGKLLLREDLGREVGNTGAHVSHVKVSL